MANPPELVSGLLESTLIYCLLKIALNILIDYFKKIKFILAPGGVGEGRGKRETFP